MQIEAADRRCAGACGSAWLRRPDVPVVGPVPVVTRAGTGTGVNPRVPDGDGRRHTVCLRSTGSRIRSHTVKGARARPLRQWPQGRHE